MTEYLEPISRQEFVDWKHHPVTKRVFSEIAQEMNVVATRILATAGKNSEEDNYYRGVFTGLKALLEVDLEGDETDA